MFGDGLELSGYPLHFYDFYSTCDDYDDYDDDDGRRARGLAHLSGLGASAVPTVRASTSPAVPAS